MGDNLEEIKTLPENNTIVFDKIRDLKYGENPSQTAALYTNDSSVDYNVLFERELSYNNILDVSVASGVASEFFDVNCAVIVKHSSPCAAALGKTLREALEKALSTRVGRDAVFSRPEISIGNQDFKAIIDNGYFYVDKTSGSTKMVEKVPNLDVEEEAGTIDLFDYLEKKN